MAKLLLKAFKALHDYEWDTIRVKGHDKQSTLTNIKNAKKETQAAESRNTTKDQNITEAENQGVYDNNDDDEDYASEDEQTEVNEQDMLKLDAATETSIFTRNEGKEGAFRKERVDAMMKMIKIGEDFTPEQ